MASSDTRKIRAAGGSLAVMLPHGWTRYLGLRPGDLGEVIANGDLLIRPLRKERTHWCMGKVVRDRE